MSKHENDDRPMFSGPVDNNAGIKIDPLVRQKFNSDNRRKNKILGFGMSAVKWTVIIIGVLIVLDIIVQLLNFDNELIKDCFSLLKYSLTTVLGFVFANNSNKT